MKRTEIGSRIEIWSANYINKNITRKEEDENVDIIQIENANVDGDYIVEISPKSK